VFSVMFEVHPRPDQFDGYLSNAKMLRPELERVDGFVDNIRYASLTRKGWILSLSGWRDEKALVRWRTQAKHHDVQEQGRAGILMDYHLRVGQITADTNLPDGQQLLEQRLDETEVGEGTTAVLITAQREPGLSDAATVEQTAASLALSPRASGLAFWDVYDAVLQPGDLLLHTVWHGVDDANALQPFSGQQRRRQVRIVRDYSKNDRREAPQFYPPAPNGPMTEKAH
jgi:heme-degrading monooxygenase HmoA